MSEETETLYRIGFIDLMLIFGTRGMWALWIYCFKGVEVPVSAIDGDGA